MPSQPHNPSSAAIMPVVRSSNRVTSTVNGAYQHPTHVSTPVISAGYHAGAVQAANTGSHWPSTSSSFTPSHTPSVVSSSSTHAHMPNNSAYTHPAPHYAHTSSYNTPHNLGYAQSASVPSHTSHFSSTHSSHYGNGSSSTYGSHDRHSSHHKVHNSGKGRHGSHSVSAHSAQRPTVQLNPLDLQLQKWLDQRQNLPPLWGVRTIILDTNVLLDEASPDVLHDLHRLSSDLTFIVPYVLVQELDSLKARAHGPKYAARQAITRLHEMLVQSSKKEKWIRGQKADERLPLTGTLQTTSGDDRILECVNYFHTYSPKGKKAMLLTHDKNLQLKASILGMTTGGVAQLKTFFDGYKWLLDERQRLKTQLISANVTSNTHSMRIPDWKLEDYLPEDQEEEDEFQKVKREAAAAAAALVEEKAKSEKAALEASKHAALHADALSRLPEGTRIDLYDDSTESAVSSPRSVSEVSQQFTSKKEASASTTPAVSDTELSEDSTVSKASSDQSREKSKKKKDKKDKKEKEKKKKRKDKHKEKKRKRVDSDEEPEEAPANKKATPAPDVIIID